MTKGLNGLRSAVVVLGLAACTATGADAAPILKYQTATAVDLSTGISGPNVISFTPASNSLVNLGSGYASLGAFVLAAPPDGTSTTYTNTPFSITFLPQSLDGDALTSQSAVFTGVLNGPVGSNGTSNVQATFNNPSQVLDLGDQKLTFTFPDKIWLASSTSFDGVSTVQVGITSSQIPPVPEPSTVALILTTIGGLALRRRVSGRSARVKA